MTKSESAARVFFVPHALELPRSKWKANPSADDDTPRRVPMRVSGTVVSRTGAAERVAIVMLDGYPTRDGVILGGNQDPCVFAAPHDVFHAFCRIVGGNASDNQVRVLGTGTGVLPEVAKEGDTIVFGRPDPVTNSVGVDTVIVVAGTPTFMEVLARTPVESDAFIFNVSDELPLGFHSGQRDHRVIVGIVDRTWAAVTGGASSFVPFAERTGDGQLRVLRVPLATLDADVSAVLSERFALMFSGRGSAKNRGFVVELPLSAGRALVRAVATSSRSGEGVEGEVFVPPLRPVQMPRRLGRDGEIRSGEDHVMRLLRQH